MGVSGTRPQESEKGSCLIKMYICNGRVLPESCSLVLRGKEETNEIIAQALDDAMNKQLNSSDRKMSIHSRRQSGSHLKLKN